MREKGESEEDVKKNKTRRQKTSRKNKKYKNRKGANERDREILCKQKPKKHRNE